MLKVNAEVKLGSIEVSANVLPKVEQMINGTDGLHVRGFCRAYKPGIALLILERDIELFPSPIKEIEGHAVLWSDVEGPPSDNALDALAAYVDKHYGGDLRLAYGWAGGFPWWWELEKRKGAKP